MYNKLQQQLEESLAEWANIDKEIAERQKKDKRIISTFCAQNTLADMTRILYLLEKYNGMPKYDKEIVIEFKQKYPDNLDAKILSSFLDIKDMYSQILEAGGDDND